MGATIQRSTEAIPNRHLAVYALSVLGGDTKQIHTEDIALKCFELFPHSFSWVRYPQHPDKDIARIALCDARKAKYGALVEGRAGRSMGMGAGTGRARASDGWRLTARGLEWIKENQSRLEEFAGSGIVKEHRQKILRQLKRVKDHPLYAQYLDSPDRFHPAIGTIADLLRCRVDAEPEIWDERFRALMRKARVTEQAEVSRFVELCTQAYLRQR